MNLYIKEDVTKYIWKAGEKLWTSVNRLFEQYNVPAAVKGFWPCPSFVNQEGAPRDLISRILRASYKNGVSLYNVSYVNYSHKDADIEETITRMEKAIAEVATTL